MDFSTQVIAVVEKPKKGAEWSEWDEHPYFCGASIMKMSHSS